MPKSSLGIGTRRHYKNVIQTPYFEWLFHETLREKPGGEGVKAQSSPCRGGGLSPAERQSMQFHISPWGPWSSVTARGTRSGVRESTTLNLGGTSDLVTWTFNSRSHLVYPSDSSELTAKKLLSFPIKEILGHQMLWFGHRSQGSFLPLFLLETDVHSPSLCIWDPSLLLRA